jgi:hypothetical protein
MSVLLFFDHNRKQIKIGEFDIYHLNASKDLKPKEGAVRPNRLIIGNSFIEGNLSLGYLIDTTN